MESDQIKEQDTNVNFSPEKEPFPENLSEHDKYYKELIGSFERFIPAETQESFRNARILVAGAGSIGSPIAEMCVRQGAENIIVADPDKVEVGNLSRQAYSSWQVGKNKAQMTALNLRLINPVPSNKEVHGTVDNLIYKSDKEDLSGIRSITDGITDENVKELVSESDVVVDAIDIRALDMMYKLHKEAAEQRKPVIVGYDMAGTALIVVYRYDLKDREPLDGTLTEETLKTFQEVKNARDEGDITEGDFMNFVYNAFSGPIRPLDVPVEQLEEILSRKGDERTPQLGTTSRTLSALAVETLRRIVNGEEVKEFILADNPSLVRKRNPSVFRRVLLMALTLRKLKLQANEVKKLLNTIET